MKRYEIRIAGFGGQGVVTVGKIAGIAAALHDKRNAVQTQSYGPESRGGACKAEVVLADGEIHYPKVRSADVLVALSQTAQDAYLKDLKQGGLLIVDPLTVIKDPPRSDLNIVKDPYRGNRPQSGKQEIPEHGCPGRPLPADRRHLPGSPGEGHSRDGSPQDLVAEPGSIQERDRVCPKMI